MNNLLDIIRNRHSERVPFDPERRVSDADLDAILEAARWAPTAHNMQNFEIVIVDDEATLSTIARVHGAHQKSSFARTTRSCRSARTN